LSIPLALRRGGGKRESVVLCNSDI